jgi:hypothetical protein
VITFPGGYSYGYKTGLAGQEAKIRSFISSGGSYYGICAGSFYAPDSITWLGKTYAYFCFGEFISICLLAAKTLPWLNTRLVAVPEARWSRGKGQTSLLKMTLRPAFWRCRAAWRRSVPA